MNTNESYIQQHISKLNPTMYKTIVQHDQAGFNPGMLAQYLKISPCNQSPSEAAEEKDMATSRGTEKASDKIQEPSMIKLSTHKKVRKCPQFDNNNNNKTC